MKPFIALALWLTCLSLLAADPVPARASIFDAIRSGDRAMVKALLKNGADVQARDEFGNTPLMAAAWLADVGMLELLLKAGAEVNATNKARFIASPLWSSNRPPTSLNLPAPFTLSEASPVGTLVASFTTADPDPGNLFIYSILSGNEDGAFTLDRWSGQLRVASLDYERKSNYVLTVTVFVLTNLVVDLLYAWLDPRIRFA